MENGLSKIFVNASGVSGDELYCVEELCWGKELYCVKRLFEIFCLLTILYITLLLIYYVDHVRDCVFLL